MSTLLDPTMRTRTIVWIGVSITLLLTVRFLSGVSLAAFSLSGEALDLAGRVLEAYEILLPFVILAAILILVLTEGARSRRKWQIAIVAFHFAALALWLSYISGPPSTRDLFPAFAVVSVALGSILSLTIMPPARSLAKDARGIAYFAILTIVPIVFALRAAEFLGYGTTADPEGVYHGDWLVVNIPTLLLEFLSIGIWVYLFSGLDRATLRRRWRTLLPFTLLPVLALAFHVRPLSGYIFSALIAWGSNLAIFVPVWFSLNLAAATVASWFSTLLLVRRRPRDGAWILLVMGTADILIAGFALSMASVAGLAFAQLLIAISLSRWKTWKTGVTTA